MKKSWITSCILCLLCLLSSCEKGIFGVDEVIWNTLSEKERERVIEGYSRRKETELANKQKREEKELENERHRQEVEAQTAPFYAAADAISSICGIAGKTKGGALRIYSVSTGFGTQKLTVGNTELEISPFSRMSQAWVNGQKVQLTKNDKSLLYPIKIENLDNGETIEGRKSRG